MFTWKPIYNEIANKLLDFQASNGKLIAMLKRFQEQGLLVSSLKDRSANDKEIQLAEIDPFTFFGNFNRGIRDENRKAILAAIKNEWGLAAPVPTDFHGLPLLDMRRGWLMPYAKARPSDHVPTLWEFYRSFLPIVDVRELDTELFDACIDLKYVGLATLTMGMFWARPEIWVALDAKNRDLAQHLGVKQQPTNGIEYIQWIEALRNATEKTPAEFSHEAHLRATTKPVPMAKPFSSVFRSEAHANEVLDNCLPVLEALDANEEEDRLSCSVHASSKVSGRLTVVFGRWMVFRYQRQNERGSYEILLPKDSPLLQAADVTFSYDQKVSGKAYVLAKFDESKFNLTTGELKETLRKSLSAALRAFADYQSTPYGKFHTWGLIELTMDPNVRPDVLYQGLETAEQDVDYWLLAPGQNARMWPDWQAAKIGAIGWSNSGDLTEYESKEQLAEYWMDEEEEYGTKAAVGMLWSFANEIKLGDIVFAKDGLYKICGWGVVTGEYRYDEEQEEYCHVIGIDWQSNKVHTMDGGVQLAQRTLSSVTNKQSFLAEMARTYPGIPGLDTAVAIKSPPPAPPIVPYTLQDALKDLFIPEQKVQTILQQLRRKKNLVLQGAPGTGKTFVARRLAYLLLEEKDKSRAPLVQFHQSTTYEDFIQGYRPNDERGFNLRDGNFFTFVKRAHAAPEKDFVFIIDEINRGNLAKIFGELMMLIEFDKRSPDYAVPLNYASEGADPFFVPENVYLIGTMNTADRSLSMVDYALRRRFAFVELDPGFESPSFEKHLTGKGASPEVVAEIRRRMSKLNSLIMENTLNLGRGYRIGHSYFVPSDGVTVSIEWVNEIMEFEVVPLLEEYWCDDPVQLDQAKQIAMGAI